MHKNEIKICLLLIAAIIFASLCCSKITEIDELRTRQNCAAEKQKTVAKFAEQIKNASFEITKTKGELNALSKNNFDLKKVLNILAKKSRIRDVKIKKKEERNRYYKVINVEIRFSAEREYDIYRFLLNLCKKLNVSFDSIKIIRKGGRNFIVQIICKCFSYNIKGHSIEIRPIKKEKRIAIKHLQLFKKDDDTKNYILHAIIDKNKAYINNEWKNIGDKIDDNYEIKNIFANSIRLQNDDEELLDIKLGDSW